MKTQISRNSNQPQQRYSGVYQQQGRMITDADWNESADVEKQRVWSALLDAVRSGAPQNGGFKINPDKTLDPGPIYVDGIPAQLTGNAPVPFTSQPDFPGAPALPAANFTLYADVWERAVTALEDTGLVDAGLHGADTCTRTQTMLQVKWCATTLNPENSADNHPHGTAELKLKLRQILAGGDACDPCASQINVDERAGNYLFRVEVHNVHSQGGNSFLTLKWSRDNGAEQYKVDNVPIDFQQGDWIYEFYDNTTEKQLGMHLAPGFSPKRGELTESYSVPTLPSKPKTYVRQWDGYCVLNLTTAALVSGKDKGVALATTYSDDAQARVTIDAASFKVNLDLLELELSLAGKVFVAGDFWQAAIREALHHSGDFVLGTAPVGINPMGVHHHYLRLASVDGSGNVAAQTDAERRRFNFPPLTDIKAADVGFNNTCAGLFGTAENVQQALSALCGIAADDIAYTPPVCAVTPSVASLMGPPWPDVDGDAKVSVKDMLDALLCRLNASRLPHIVPNCGTPALPSVRSLLNLAPGGANVGQILDQFLCNLNADHIPFVKTGLTTCTELSAPTVLTVQDALEVLCQKAGSGCSATVGAGGQYTTLASAFAAYMLPGAPQDMLLCLLPGEHVLPADVAVTGKRSIKISGSGVTASVVRFQGALLHLQSQEIQLGDAAVDFSQESGRILLEADNVSAEDCVFRRVGKAPGGAPLVMVKTSSAGGDVRLQNNTIQSSWQRLATNVDIDRVIPSAIASVELRNGVSRLLSDEVFVMDAKALNLAISGVAESIVGLPANSKTVLANTNRTVAKKKSVRAKNAVALAALGVDEDSPSFSETIVQPNISVEAVSVALGDLVLALWETGYSAGLAIWSHRVGGFLTGNEILGEILILNDGNFGPDLGKRNVVQVVQGNPVSPVGAKMDLIGNQIARFSVWAPANSFDPDDNGRLWKPVPCFAILNISNNLFIEAENAFLGGVVSMQGNRFAANPEFEVATVLDNQFLASGNSAPAGIHLRHRSGQTAASANLMGMLAFT